MRKARSRAIRKRSRAWKAESLPFRRRQIIATGASLGVGRTCDERAAISRHCVGVDAEFLRDRIGAEPCAQLLGDFALYCGVECRAPNRLAAFSPLHFGAGHTGASSLPDFLRL